MIPPHRQPPTAFPCRPLRLVLALVLVLAPGLRSAPPEDTVTALGARIEALLGAPRFAAASWGVQVVSLASGRTLFEHDARKLLVPASSAKLFTAALALHLLGPEFRIRTSLYGPGRPGADGVLRGDLVFHGRGDPAILQPGSGADPLEALAEQLRAAGVRAIAGDLVGDDGHFATQPYGSGWEAGDLQLAFGAAPSALTVHGNAVDLWVYPGAAAGQPCFLFAMPGHGVVPLLNQTTTGTGGLGIQVERPLGDPRIRVTGSLPPGGPPLRLAVTVADPALFAAQLLHRALLRHGIAVAGRVRSRHFQDPGPAPEALALLELAHLDSPPLLELVRATLKDSVNLNAQLLLLQAGALNPGENPANSEQRGLTALGAFLGVAGVAPSQVLLEEGSGLSRKNLVTPAALVDLLRYLSRQPAAAAFRNTLPLAGADGTLASRMLGTAAQFNVQAKTGTLRYTHSLAGYVTSAAGEPLAFAVMLNNYRYDAAAVPAAPAPRADLDAIAILLAEFRGLSSPTP